MMKMCMQICKFSLFFLNILFFIAGVVLIHEGVKNQLKGIASEMLQISVTSPFNTAAKVFIILGIVIILVALIANYGACMHKTSVLIGGSGLLSLLTIINIVVGVMAFMRIGQMADDLTQFYEKTYTEYQDGDYATVNFLHNMFKCCGIGGEIKQPVQYICPKDLKDPFPSCPSVILQDFSSYAPLVLVGFLGLAGIMIVAVVCNVVLSRHLLHSDEPLPAYAKKWGTMQKNCIENIANGLIS